MRNKSLQQCEIVVSSKTSGIKLQYLEILLKRAISTLLARLLSLRYRLSRWGRQSSRDELSQDLIRNTRGGRSSLPPVYIINSISWFRDGHYRKMANINVRRVLRRCATNKVREKLPISSGNERRGGVRPLSSDIRGISCADKETLYCNSPESWKILRDSTESVAHLWTPLFLPSPLPFDGNRFLYRLGQSRPCSDLFIAAEISANRKTE